MSAPNAPLGFTHLFTPGADAAQPTLLLLHGTGGNELDMISLGKLLSLKTALLSTPFNKFVCKLA
jgi:phospholipase/carboxylesterase